MGSALSTRSERGRDTEHVTSESVKMSVDANAENTEEEFRDAANEDDERTRAKEEKMDEFKKQLSIKREQRREILARHRTDKEELEKALKNERASKLELCQKNDQLREILLKNNIEIPENLLSPTETSQLSEVIGQMREEFEKLKSDNIKLRRDLVAANTSLQGAYSDIADLNGHNLESMKQIQALKEVVSVSKTLINLREDQLNELKEKLREIERSLGEREANMLSVDLRREYERQLQNIRTLRGLYEERARLAEVTRQGLVRDLEEQKSLYQLESNKCKDLAEKVTALEAKVESLLETIDSKNNDIAMCQNECKVLKAEMTVVNKLFSQVLLGYKTKQDLDKLVHRLEENHGLLTHMAGKEDDAEASSALPKLLLELVSQVEEIEDEQSRNNEGETLCDGDKQNTSEKSDSTPSTAEEIVENLPKVWRVLMELLSHQTVVDDSTEKVTTCYKSVETTSGPVLVPSVSQTYIRLKDLIVEKLGLVKEVNRMKQLNTHLENRLQEQEKRLCLVTTELSKTWHVVGKLRRHHYQLHTHEKILKYELQQKRKLLNEIKEELEYCRDKWEQAREKNTQSERDWRELRAEFSSRKIKAGSPSFNNSGESGYSDERPSDDSSESNDESEYVTEPIHRCKKKLKKSLENVLDSSADCNLTAEREDPVSDMLDVADLPLDAQDGECSHDSSLECSRSDNVTKSEKTCETEDEIADITNDEGAIGNSTNTNENNIYENKLTKDFERNILSSSAEFGPSSSHDKPEKLIDPATILENVRKQNESLARKDERLEKLEKSSAALLKTTELTAKISNEINSTLDFLISRPTSSSDSQFNNQEFNETNIHQSEPQEFAELHETPETIHTDNLNSTELDTHNEMTSSVSVDQEIASRTENTSETTSRDFTNTTVATIDFQAILQNVKKQNERLERKDERLQNLESGCVEVVQNLSNTLNKGEEIIEKLDTLHSEHTKEDQYEKETLLCPNDSTDMVDHCEPSTSSDNAHEARFAARDLRLKRLEEQTKRLVNKVNKTNSKGIKINYKLEELHNIYGSESSRAGTPSEDTEDKSRDDDEDDSNE